MEEAIRSIPSQFDFDPVIENESKLKPADGFVVCGMGGSHISAGLLKMYNPNLNIYIHRDYGVPRLSEKRFKNSLYIASSYSGNTEETLDFAEKAFSTGYNVAVIATGGKLIEFAKKNNVPYIVMPQTGVQPRVALGFSLLSLAKFMEGDEAVSELQKHGHALNPNALEKEGLALAQELKNKIPVIYASRANQALAYSWKIKFNETAKIPAFHNVFPELNHNEINGYDVMDSTRDLSSKFHFIFLEDTDDEPRIMRRMEVLKKLYADQGFPVSVLHLEGKTVFEEIFNSLMLADWTALSLSGIYGTEPEAVPMVEEFKKLIA